MYLKPALLLIERMSALPIQLFHQNTQAFVRVVFFVPHVLVVHHLLIVSLTLKL